MPKQQVDCGGTKTWDIAKMIYKQRGVAGLFQGLPATIVRDVPSFGVYFAVYEGLLRGMGVNRSGEQGKGYCSVADYAAVITSVCACYLLCNNRPHISLNTLFVPELTVREFLALNFAGGWAGVIAWTSIYPIDVVKSRLQTQPLDAPMYRSLLHCARELYRNEGAAVYSRGLLATVLRAFPLNAVTFSFYELSMRVLEGRTA